jgi:hypothetical protein
LFDPADARALATFWAATLGSDVDEDSTADKAFLEAAGWAARTSGSPSGPRERRLFGCVRVVFNDGLRSRKAAHEAGLPYITDAELSARLTASKKTPERAWLGEVSSVPLQQSLADLNIAYKSFFNSIKGNRKGPKIGPPRL